MIIDDIRDDPQWLGGNYKTQPFGLTAATDILLMMSGSPLTYQKAAPTRDAADELLEKRRAAMVAEEDANDLLYAVSASRDYDPSADLEKIKAPVMAVNTADDQINPPELGIAETLIARVPHGRFVLIPIGPQTRGHGTHTIAAVWEQYLSQLLQESVKDIY
jgi:homoserine O-acetyltransferase